MDHAASLEDGQGLSGVRLNLGRIEGGIKPNMIASKAHVWWGVRPGPSHAPTAVVAAIAALAGSDGASVLGFVAPALPSARDADDARARQARVRSHLDHFGIACGPAVDFWTEAALFSQAGYDTAVLGPGDIAQAHTVGEWVAIDQLTSLTAIYEQILSKL